MSLFSRSLRSLCRAAENYVRPLTALQSAATAPQRNFHLCPVLSVLPPEPKNWPKYNDIIYPVQKQGEPTRPAEVVHHVSNVKYSLKKMWYIAAMIRGMSVDEALKQLSFMRRKGSVIAKETIEEAIEIAVRDHNVEFRSNLWIADSFATKGVRHKGWRKRAMRPYAIIHYDYIHYYVRLREGKPPKHYFPPPADGRQKIADYIDRLRSRGIQRAL